MLIQSIHTPIIEIKGATESTRRGTWREGWMTSIADRSAIVSLLRMINAQDVIEIGVHEGYTAACILENVDSVKSYLGVYVLTGYSTTLPQQQGEVPAHAGAAVRDARFKLILRKRGSFDLVTGGLGPCDAMFIYGDHSRDVVINDTALALLCVRDQGMILWHDCCEEWDNDVRAVLEEMVRQGYAIQHVADTRIAFMRGGEQ